jgi:hypothetical protein
MTHDDDDAEDLFWSPEASAEIRNKVARRLAELAAGDRAAFDVGIVSLVNVLTAAAADASSLQEWRHLADAHRRDDPGTGQDEIEQAADTIAAVLAWVAWAIADSTDEINPEIN